MGLRITSWNVNGIRNPFGYQPWRDKRTFSAMFDILEADIVVFQETKIQRKDLTDDMVLVPGWDCYFSLPRHKKGYSGVVVYTRQSTCSPIRAEEGITGLLCPPNSSKSFSELADGQQIGGYPTPAQLALSAVDATSLDSEGRCVILEFPAFVLLGVYSPANRDESRDDFRHGFLNVLDARVRNLVAMGKHVFLTGDLNISREELDTANAEANMRKQGLTGFEFVSTPARRLLNQLIEGGKVFSDRDEGREQPVLWDICRAFHPNRKGMFTCWEQKVNARPSNCGSRIDYVLCSLNMKGWFSDSNIQEGLMGSDHCPVYAVLQERVTIHGKSRHIQDVMNSPGTFVDGIRQRDHSTLNDLLPTSGRLIPEFFRRRNIRDMFIRPPTLQPSQNLTSSEKSIEASKSNAQTKRDYPSQEDSSISALENMAAAPSSQVYSDSSSIAGSKRSISAKQPKSSKRNKFASPSSIGKGQRSLNGFFRSKSPKIDDLLNAENLVRNSADGGHGMEETDESSELQRLPAVSPSEAHESAVSSATDKSRTSASTLSGLSLASACGNENFVDPVESKESWSKLFTKPLAPRCEGHNEACIMMLTKKAGMNLGRSFWMCPRPLGPSGGKERNTQWRCQTFIWCSDWNSNAQ